MLKNFKKYLLIVMGLSFIILNFGPIVLAQDKITVEEIISNMQNQENKIQDLQFHLHQIIKIKELKEKQQVRGKVIYKKPDNLLVEYDLPQPQLILINKDQIVVYNLDDRGKWQEMMRDKISKIIGSRGKTDYGLWTSSDILANYKIKLTSSDKREVKEYILLLEPKEATVPFTLKIWIKTVDWIPYKTVWEDDYQVITMDLSQIKINSGVSNEIFKAK